jgi:hypothetical protein
MASQNKMVLKAFIKQLDECLEDIQTAYPNIMKTDARFVKVVTFMDTLKMSNPKLIVTTWKDKVNTKYKDKIFEGDIKFFLAKDDYKNEASPEYYTEETETVINDLRRTITEMSPVNIQQCMRYIQNLCKLADMYV